MIEASCHCGAVRFAVDAAPAAVNDCTCSICRRIGTLWAYYPVAAVRFAADSGPTDVYMWNGRTLKFHRCRVCGCVSHWAPAGGGQRTGVNVRLMPPAALAGIPMLRNGEALGTIFSAP